MAQHDRKLLFDSKLYRRAKDELYRIKIGSGKNAVIGILKESFAMDMQAEWANLISMDNFAGETAQRAAGYAGVGLFNSGIWTRKYFKNGAYIIISPAFRVVDWEGTGIVISTAKRLQSYTMPRGSKGISNAIGGITESGGEDADGNQKQGVSLSSALQPGGSIDALAGSIGKDVKNALSSAVTISPPPVSVKISTFFSYSPMIITNVSVTFSKELTPSGPMFADFTVGLSSQEAGFGYSGIKNTQIAPRVNFS